MNATNPGSHGAENAFVNADLAVRTLRYQFEPVGLDTTDLRIALVQLDGPHDDGKVKVVLHNRETYGWKSLNAMHTRQEKALAVLEFLASQKPHVSLVLFPEYSLPLEGFTPALHEVARAHSMIIIGGADNLRQPDGSVLTQSPLLLPDRMEPLWVTKCHLSKWEHPYFDEPLVAVNPVLTWKVGSVTYHLVTCVCLDFTYSLGDAPQWNGPTIYCVPMCSPDMVMFRNYADTLIAVPGGRAAILSNCVGNPAGGSSGVFALRPTGKRFIPVTELPPRGEGFALFSLSCDRLVPPRMSLDGTSCVREISIFELPRTRSDPRVVPVQAPSGKPKVSARAIINPALFRYRGKILRMAFVNVESYGKLNQNELAKKLFECYAVLGQHDLMVAHLDSDASEMLFDIVQSLPVSQALVNVGPPTPDTFPHFEITRYHKVLGVPIPEDGLAAITRAFPDSAEFDRILALATNWDDERITPEDRNRFQTNKWILGSTVTAPGDIDAVMTLFINCPGEQVKPLQDFEDRVLPSLKDNIAITSIVEGVGRRMSVHYVLRLACGVDELFALIEEVHRLAERARLVVTTSTMVIVRKWSALALEQCLQVADLTRGESEFRSSHLFPKLTKEEQGKFVSLSLEQQRQLIAHARNTVSSLRRLESRAWIAQQLEGLVGDLVRGLAREDLEVLAQPHNVVQGQVERLLRESCSRYVDEDCFERSGGALNIPKGKDRTKLSYAEWLRIASFFAERGSLPVGSLDDLRRLSDETREVRNAMAHKEWEKLSITAFVQAFAAYCSFLDKWEFALRST